MIRKTLSTVILIGMAMAITAPLSAQARTYINPRSVSDEGAPPPFSGAVWVGDLLFLSGTLGLQDGQVPESAEEEARLVMESMKSMLEAAGLTMDDLVSVQVFCSDVDLYDIFNNVYRTYFTGNFPARAFVGSGTLLYGARWEVQGIASRN